jgi:hypothetical protein
VLLVQVDFVRWELAPRDRTRFNQPSLFLRVDWSGLQLLQLICLSINASVNKLRADHVFLNSVC